MSDDSTNPDSFPLPGTAYFRDGATTVAIEAVASREQLERILEPRTQDAFILGLIWNLIEHVQARDAILVGAGFELRESP